jgi:D-amino-acid oxidase
MAKSNVVVIGAGVVGLTTALLLAEERQYNITVVAKHMPGDYDIEYASPWAGANFLPVSSEGTPAARRDANTWPWLSKCAREHPETGIAFEKSYAYGRKKDLGPGNPFSGLFSTNPWFKNVLTDYQQLPQSEVPSGIDSASVFTSVCINTAIYLPWLVSQCLKRGVVFKRGVLKHISEVKADLVINCTGLGALKLGGVQDTKMYPGRGQVVVVRNTSNMEMHTASGTDAGADELTYIMQRPAGGGTILGGCFQPNKWESQFDPNLAVRIMHRAVALCPALTGGKGIEHLDVIRHGVGLRPMRDGGARIEKEKINGCWIVHNYGHGGYGYQSSYGCALEAKQLVDSVLKKQSKL